MSSVNGRHSVMQSTLNSMSQHSVVTEGLAARHGKGGSENFLEVILEPVVRTQVGRQER